MVYRHCAQNAPQKSNWYTNSILAPNEARIQLALPNANTAVRVIKVKIKKGTFYVEGPAASQIDNPVCGAYAKGGGDQYYFLDEDISSSIEVLEDIKNPYIE